MDSSSMFQDKPQAYAGSIQALRSELDLFNIPSTDVSVQFSSDYQPCYPLVSVKDSYNPVEFLKPSKSAGYLDLANSMAAFTCRILRANETNCDSTDIVCPSSNFFHALFSTMEVYLNGVLISNANNYYATVGYLQRLLSTTSAQKDNELQSEFWFPNAKKGVFATTFAGFNQRYELTKNSKEFTLMGKLSCNLFNQARYLPAGSEVRILLRRSLPDVCLNASVDKLPGLSGCPYMVQIVDAVYCASKKVVAQQVMQKHKEELALGKKFAYPITNVDMKTFSVAQGLTSASSEGLVLGRPPKIIVIGLVSSKAFLGKISKDAFNFVNKNLAEIAVTWNEELIQHRVILLSFETSNEAGLDSFLYGLRTLKETAPSPLLGNGINRTNYKNGNVLVAVDLLPNDVNSLAVMRKGQVKISLKFKSPLDEPVNVIAYCQFHGLLEIGSQREVYIE